MSVKPVSLTPAQLTTSVATYYTVGANKNAIVKNMTVCNSTGTARTFTIHRVPSGGTAGVTNIVVSARPIAAGETQSVWEFIGKVLAVGDTIQALADANTAVTLDGSVAEVV